MYGHIEGEGYMYGHIEGEGYMYGHREGEVCTCMDTERVRWVHVWTHRG